MHTMTDYLVISTDPDERGARTVLDQTVLRRLLRDTVVEPREAREPQPEREERPEHLTGHCRYATYYED